MESVCKGEWIEITGNWHEGTGFSRGLIVSEPVPPPEGNLFSQTLRLPAGAYELKLVYDSQRDQDPFLTLFYRPERFLLRINGEERAVEFRPDSGEAVWCARTTIRMERAGEAELSMRVRATRVFETYLKAGALPASRFAAVPAGDGAEVTLVRGIPFLSRPLSERLNMWTGIQWLSRPRPQGGIVDWKDAAAVYTGDAPVRRAYFLGMTHAYDFANGSWYAPKGENGFSHFVGDRVGTLLLRFGDGGEERVPLVFGFNVWYGNPWDLLWDRTAVFSPATERLDARTLDATFFGGNEAYRETLRRGVGLDDAVRRQGARHNQRFLFTLDLEGRRLRSVEVLEGEMRFGCVIVSGITLELAGEGGDALTPLPELAPEPGEVRVWTLEEVRNRTYEPDLERIRRVLYTYTDELPRLEAPEIPEGYVGPQYDFRGPDEAPLAATFLYWNGPECAAYIGDGGMTCSSQTARWRTMPYMSGMGVWMRTEPTYDGLCDFLQKYRSLPAGCFPPRNGAWSRGVGELLREAMALGYDKCVDNYVDWMDEALFREANPPHWNRIIGSRGEGYHVCTVGDEIERGNRENDGHGICMWGRYMVWLWKGRDPAWNRRHYAATRAAADWIEWQLKTDTLRPGRRIDLLYTESECAHGDYDFYSSFSCLRGLTVSMRMAAALGEWEDYARWSGLRERLAQGILEHLRDPEKEGLIWHTEAGCDWQDHAHKLAHLHAAPDGDTYTPLEDDTAGIDAEFLETDRTTYRYLMRDGNYNCLRMYGYGQGMMLQAALLLDEMADAERFLKLLVTHNYLPRMEKWICPEGILVHPDGEFYLPVNGYMGQDSHVADSTKAVRLLLGVDDNRQDLVRLIPRFPQSWTRCSVAEYPVLLGDRRGTLAYVLERGAGEMRLRASFSGETALDVRMGPLPVAAQVTGAEIGGKPAAFESYRSGDSRWVRICGMRGREADVRVTWTECRD